MISLNDKRKIVFHLRPWEVNLYVALEEYLSRNYSENLEFFYLTHNVKTDYLLEKKGRKYLNLNREWEKITLPEDWPERLQEIENRCKGYVRNLNQYLAAERYLKGKPRKYQNQQLYRTVIFYDSFFARHKPFFMLSAGPDHMAFWLSMDLLRYHGGHPCGLVSTSWPPNQIIFYRQVGQSYWTRECYTNLLARGLTDAEKEEAHERQEHLRQGKAIPIFINPKKEKMAPKRTFLEKVKNRLDIVFWQIAERKSKSWYIHPIPILTNNAKASLIRFRARLVNRYLADGFGGQRPFVFFPLHLEPEATLLVHANFFDNQLEIIKILSKALPASWVLVVKDHPNMIGQRPLRFIREVKQLPNVLFIRGDEPSWRLISTARLVVVITSTAGLEACLLGKSVLTFGDPSWNYAPTCRKVGDITKLPESILEAAAAELPPEDPRVQAFLLSWVRANPPGICDYVPFLSPADHPENVDRLGQALIRLFHDLEREGIGSPLQ